MAQTNVKRRAPIKKGSRIVEAALRLAPPGAAALGLGVAFPWIATLSGIGASAAAASAVAVAAAAGGILLQARRRRINLGQAAVVMASVGWAVSALSGVAISHSTAVSVFGKPRVSGQIADYSAARIAGGGFAAAVTDPDGRRRYNMLIVSMSGTMTYSYCPTGRPNAGVVETQGRWSWARGGVVADGEERAFVVDPSSGRVVVEGREVGRVVVTGESRLTPPCPGAY